MIGFVKGPQMCSMRSGFLKTLMMIAELRVRRMIYVMGFVCSDFLLIMNLNYTQLLRIQTVRNSIDQKGSRECYIDENIEKSKGRRREKRKFIKSEKKRVKCGCWREKSEFNIY